MIAHKDRVPLYPGRVKLTPVSGQADVFDLVRDDGAVQIGTPLNKALLDEFLAASGITTGSATALTLAQTGFVLVDGATIRFKLHIDSGATPTINVNGTGAKAVMTTKYKPLKANTSAGTWLTAVYSSTFGFFVLQGSGAVSASRYGNEVNQVSTFELFLVGQQNPYFSR